MGHAEEPIMSANHNLWGRLKSYEPAHNWLITYEPGAYPARKAYARMHGSA